MKNIKFITAGAGSGKTFTLTKELVARMKGGLQPDQIILTTFTKAAAEEFKQKAAKALMEAGKKTEAQQLAGAMIGTIDSVAQTFVQKYWYLLGLSPELNVMSDTERSFYEVNSLTDAGLVSSEDLEFFAELRDTFNITKYTGERYVDDDNFWMDDLRKIIELRRNYAIADFKKTTDESKKLIYELFDKKDVVIDWKYVLDFYKTADIIVYDNKGLQKIKKGVPCFSDKLDYQKSAQRNYKTIIDGFGIKPNNTFNPTRKTYYKGDGSVNPKPDGRCDFYNDEWRIYADKCKIYLQSQTWGDLLKDYVEKICDLAKDWQDKYAEYKQQHHLMDFNDIELKFKELLAMPQVKSDIKDQYKLVMVDEFQDCNPLQVEIFDTLSELVGETIWVGDKKQSIYGFRGSDMQFIDAVIAKFPKVGDPKNGDGLESDTLKNSFRSRKKLVEMANAIFEPVFAPDPSVALNPKRFVNGTDDLDDAIGATPVAYDWHSASSNKEEYYADVAAQIKAVIYNEKCKSSKSCLDGTAPTYTIGDKKGQPFVEKYKYDDDGAYDANQREIGLVSAGDIAVLARSGPDVDKMVEALAKIGVPVNAVEHNIKEFGEIQLLMAMLNYSLHRNDYSKAQILYLWNNKPVPEIISDRIRGNEWNWRDCDDKEKKRIAICASCTYFNDHCFDDKNLRNTVILKKLDDVLDKSKGQSVLQLVETLLLRLDIWNHVAKWGNVARRHANINTFLRIVASYEEHTRLLDLACSVMGFINYFKTEDVNVDTPFIKDPNAVSVLTYHKAKGLEWPVVILDGLDDDSLDEQKLIKREFFGVQHYAKNPNEITCAKREEYMTICPRVVSGKSNVPEVLKEKIAPKVNAGGDIYERVKAEQARLLYVGFTRAKDFVITLSKGKEPSYKWLDGVGAYDKNTIWKTDSEKCIEPVTKIDIPFQAKKEEETQNDDANDSKPQYAKIELKPDFGPKPKPESKSKPKSKSSHQDEDRLRYINPSKLGKLSEDEEKKIPLTIVDKGFTPIAINLEGEQMNLIGDCIHNIYAVYDDNMTVDKVKEIFHQHGFGNKFDANAQAILDAIKKLFDHLEKEYGKAEKIYHELPVLCKLDNEQIMRGEIDLLWMLNDSEAILVDYKSKKNDADDEAPENSDEALQDKAMGYAKQLCAYKTAIEEKKNGIKVKAMVLFFPLQGKVVEVEKAEEVKP